MIIQWNQLIKFKIRKRLIAKTKWKKKNHVYDYKGKLKIVP